MFFCFHCGFFRGVRLRTARTLPGFDVTFYVLLSGGRVVGGFLVCWRRGNNGPCSYHPGALGLHGDLLDFTFKGCFLDRVLQTSFMPYRFQYGKTSSLDGLTRYNKRNDRLNVQGFKGSFLRAIAGKVRSRGAATTLVSVTCGVTRHLVVTGRSGN